MTLAKRALPRPAIRVSLTPHFLQVRCTYDTSSKNITFGMMPIRDPDMISITSAPEAPAPRYRKRLQWSSYELAAR
jgi:hypothetical protein